MCDRIGIERDAAYSKISGLTSGQSLHILRRNYNDYNYEDSKVRIECGLLAWKLFEDTYGRFPSQEEFSKTAHDWLCDASLPITLPAESQYHKPRLVNQSIESDSKLIDFFFSLYRSYPLTTTKSEIRLQEYFLSAFMHLVHLDDAHAHVLRRVLEMLEKIKIKEYPRFMGAMLRAEADALLSLEHKHNPEKLHYLLRLSEARSELPYSCGQGLNLILSISNAAPIVIDQSAHGYEAPSRFATIKDKIIPVHFEKHIHLISFENINTPILVNRLGFVQDNLDFLSEDLKYFEKNHFEFDARYNFPILKDFHGSMPRPILVDDTCTYKGVYTEDVAPVLSTTLYIFEGNLDYPYEIPARKDDESRGNKISWCRSMSVGQLKQILCTKYSENFTFYLDCVVHHDNSLHQGRALDDYELDHTKPGTYRLQVVNCYDPKRLPKHSVNPWHAGHVKYVISNNCNSSLCDVIRLGANLVNQNFPNIVLEEIDMANMKVLKDIVLLDCISEKEEKSEKPTMAVWSDNGKTKQNTIMLHMSSDVYDVAHLFAHTLGWHHSDGSLHRECSYFAPTDEDHSLRRYGWNIVDKSKSVDMVSNDDELKEDMKYLYPTISLHYCKDEKILWQCETCWGSGSRVKWQCCEECAKICHAGHRLIKAEKSSGYRCTCGAQDHKQCCTANLFGGESSVQLMSFCTTCKAMYCKSCIMNCHASHILDHNRASMVKGKCPCRSCGHDTLPIRSSSKLNLKINSNAPLQIINDEPSCNIM